MGVRLPLGVPGREPLGVAGRASESMVMVGRVWGMGMSGEDSRGELEP